MAAAVTLPGLTAQAVTDEERAGARAAATEGARAYQERRWADTVDLFTRAESLVHSPVHMLYLARARAELGQLVEAREFYLKVTREQIDPSSPAAFLQAQQDAQKELAALEPRLSYVTVSVQGRNPNEVTVKMDGMVVPQALVGVPRPVNPGEHAFQASALGEETSVSRVTVKEGGRETVVLTLEAVQPGAPAATPGAGAPVAPGVPLDGGPAPAPQPPPGDAGPQPEEGPNWMRIGSYAGFGVGAVGLGMGVIFLLQKGSKSSDADDLFGEWQSNCSPPTGGYDCEQAQSDIVALDDDASSAGTLSAVGFVLGGIGIAAGVTLFVLSSGGDEAGGPAPAQVSIAPYLGPGSLGVVGRF